MIRIAYAFLSLILLVSVFASVAYGPDYIARVYIKQGPDHDDFKWKDRIDIPAAKVPARLDRLNRENSVKSAFESDKRVDDLDTFMERNGSTALIVIKDGAVIYDAQYNSHKSGELAATFSVSKSVLSLLVGRAIDRLEISSIDAPITEHVPELLDEDSRFSGITLANLIDMRSGLAYDTDASFPFFNEDEPLVYYASNLKKTVIKRPRIEASPGDFLYNDYNPNLLALALERSSDKMWVDRIYDELWNEIGAEYPALWSSDKRGFPYAESGFVAAPIDLAKIGLEMLKAADGESDVVSSEWYARSTELQSPQPDGQPNGLNWRYRNAWWLMPRPEGPADYSAIGHLGQYIYVSPKNDVVIVRTGFGRIGLENSDFVEMFFHAADQL